MIYAMSDLHGCYDKYKLMLDKIQFSERGLPINMGILENLLNDNDVIMIDTCFAMRDEFPSFIDSIEIELMARKQRITVKSVVLAELYRHMGSADAKLRSKATKAIETICMRRNIFYIDE